MRSHLQEGHIERVVDPSLSNNFNMKDMWIMVDLALQCVQLEVVKRPKMSTICQLLHTLSMDIDTCSSSSKLWLTMDTSQKLFVIQNKVQVQISMKLRPNLGK